MANNSFNCALCISYERDFCQASLVVKNQFFYWRRLKRICALSLFKHVSMHISKMYVSQTQELFLRIQILYLQMHNELFSNQIPILEFGHLLMLIKPVQLVVMQHDIGFCKYYTSLSCFSVF